MVGQNKTKQIGLIIPSINTAKNPPALTKNPLDFKLVARSMFAS